jgi:hypothetical protein
LPRTSPRKTNLGHRLRNRPAAEKVARFWTLLKSDRGGTASTNNFTGQMTLILGGTVSINNLTGQMTLILGGTASTNSFTEQITKNAAFGRGLDRSTNLTTGGVGLAVADLHP